MSHIVLPTLCPFERGTLPPMHCHLLIPGLIPPRPVIEEIGATLRLPALATLLARGECRVKPASDIGEWLCRNFAVAKQQDWPIAPITLGGDGIEPEHYYWLRVDPVYLRVSRDRLILADSQSFSLAQAEADALTSTLNQHFASEGWMFLSPTPDRWYLRLEQAPALETHSLANAAGGYVDAHLPGGKDAQYWRGIINEIQMLFHTHPVNLAREARGELPINSAWVWGGGHLKEKPHSSFSDIWSNETLTRAFALTSNTPCASLPESAAAWLDSAQKTGTSLVVLDSLYAHAQYGDTQNWMATAQELEQRWFAPIKHALAAGKLKKMTLHALGAHGALEVTTRSKHLWRIWRRENLLSALA